MKKYLAVVLGAAIIAAPAFASKARLQALGEDITGSFYVEDNRNIFRNAALINKYSGLVTFEWGDSNNKLDTIGSSTALGANTAGPRAEGGVFTKSGNLVYGIYLGDIAEESHLFRASSAVGTGAANEQNVTSLWIGGSSSVDWGASLVYSDAENDAATAATQQKSSESMRLRLGASKDNWEGFATINLGNKAENGTGGKFEGKLGYQVGGIYKVNDYSIYALRRFLDAESQTNANVKTDRSLVIHEVGVGRVEKINSNTSLFTRVAINMTKTENDASTNTAFGTALGQCGSLGGGAATLLTCKSYDRTIVPVVIGLENRAADWLSIRGSVTHNVYGSEKADDGKKRAISNSTTVAAGATLHFGDFDIDGVIGNNPDGASAGTGTGPQNNGTVGGLGQLRTDSLMSRVSMTYRF